jgi:shikimate dehydrogenase
LRGASILLVGAGGAARGVIAPLLAQSPERLVIANRTVERAQALAARFSRRGRIEAVALDAIPHDDFTIVLQRHLHIDPRRDPRAAARGDAPGVFAYDMAYGAPRALSSSAAAALGMRASDGLGMLVEQAAESFELWRGRRPQTAPVLQRLRARFA